MRIGWPTRASSGTEAKESAIVSAAQAYRVPENLPSEAAALTEPLACALHAVDLAKMRPGEVALVLGAGPIGVLCASFLLESGASSVVVSEPGYERRDHIRELGVETIPPEDLTEGAADVVFAYDIFRRELTIRGPYTNPYAMERSLALLDSGRIDWEKIVTHRFPLSDFHEAWNVHRRGEGLKVCIYPTAS